MYWTQHITYTMGAFAGALAGALFVHCFDTIATRRFTKAKSLNVRDSTKNILKSFKPVAIGVVPMRAISYGIYSFFQEFLLLNYGLTSMAGKIMSAAISGLSLSILSTPAEIIKTRQQLENQAKKIKFYEIRKSIVPLGLRVVPTVTCMLAGTEMLQPLFPTNHLFISTTFASLVAATASQLIATPSDNIRIHRIHNEDYATSIRHLIQKIKLKDLYTGFWMRSFSLGIQASFSISLAVYLSTSLASP